MTGSRLLRATATPLASIFGSGFLVIVPILAGSVGPYALPAIVGICAIAYAIGSVIRFNIANVEGSIEARTAKKCTLYLDRSSDIAIVPAYVISVCLYLRILSSFLLSGIGLDDVFHERLLTSAIIVLITAVGSIKGLKALQKLESWALWSTMGVIVAMIVGFALFDISAISTDTLRFPALPSKSTFQIFAILGGTLICVQGFETSRYLGEEYDKATRVRSCRLSQILSTSVYIVFIAVATPLMSYLTGAVRDNSLIVLAGRAAAILPIPLIAAAVLSQFSAAVADTLGGEGNMVEASRERISHRFAYLFMGAGSIALAWLASTFEIVALASRAFALYYMIQCLVAFTVSRNILHRISLILLALLLLGIAVFAIPVG